MHKDDKRIRNVAIYARVSTEHEAQLFALENQVDWYDDILKRHDNWNLVEKYIDRGITGTSATKRPNFMRMMQDAVNGRFDLIITREVSRFARNTVDTLQYTRELKKNNIEVYFVEDNIWTFDSDGELRLTIMATLAQDESRKISLRVKAGQRTSMEKGRYFQNGSILGYDKVGDQMVINPEQATTVKMIFDLYNSGIGLRSVQWELEKAGRLTATGKTKWSASVISRTIRNKFYCGKIVWYKQYVPDFLEQKKVNNHGEKEQFEVDGTHEPIVTVEEWERANKRLDGKRATMQSNRTKKDPLDVWCRKLRCSCGGSFNRVKWHTQKSTGMKQYGYQCYERIRTGSIETRRKKGLSTEGICITPEIAGWKLEAMALYIFKMLSINKEEIITLALNAYKKHMHDGENGIDLELINSLEKELAKLEKKLDNLIDMRAEGELSKEKYLQKKSEYEERIEVLQTQLADLKGEPQEEVNYQERIDLLQDCLSKGLDFENADYIPHYVIDAFIEYIIVDGDTFKWKFNLLPDSYDLKVEGRKNNHAINRVNIPLFGDGSTGSYR